MKTGAGDLCFGYLLFDEYYILWIEASLKIFYIWIEGFLSLTSSGWTDK